MYSNNKSKSATCVNNAQIPLFLRRSIPLGDLDSFDVQVRIVVEMNKVIVVLQEDDTVLATEGMLVARFEYVASVVRIEMLMRQLPTEYAFFYYQPEKTKRHIKVPAQVLHVTMQLKEGGYCDAQWHPVVGPLPTRLLGHS
jgi:hypothetical protein